MEVATAVKPDPKKGEKEGKKMLNKAMLIGRLGADPEVRYTQSGTPVASFNIATTERWTNKDGEKQERTEWHRIVAWSRLAEVCQEYLSKGKLVYIDGRLRTRQWEDKDGNRHRATEILAQTMQMLDRVGGSSNESKNGEPPQYDGPAPGEDDIPF
jgi:single-strand DNA-binding protein